ncbi:MAG TPA: carboxypeptidase regulatory-like domain-containing protein [Sandaracinaceae bacterium LLY-WYZ-13_1]|nr:carboxypeptidase regulatory-like domain-containing protein [Sandaracinaceae bacterium LLY-WYZ-13_1]
MWEIVRTALGLLVLGVVGLHASDARAQAPGPTRDGLPGAWRVGSPDLGRTPRLSLIGTGGYGWIPALEREAGDHHRATGTAALGGVPLEHLALSAGVRGRWDEHPSDALGQDASGVGEVFVGARGGYRLPFGLALGADVRWEVPGEQAPDLAPDASRLSLRGLASFAFDDPDLTLLLHAGYRLDWSANAAGPVERYRPGDLVSLGASSFDAVLLGLGAVWTVAPVDVFLEATFEPWVGDGAPEPDTAPLRVAAGARARLVDSLRAHATVEVTAHRRVPATPEALVPAEPRLAILLGLSWTPSFGARDRAADAPADDVAQAPTENPVDAVPEPAAEPPAIAGVVRDAEGAPVEGASVALLGDDGGAPAEQEPGRTARTDPEGRYRFDDVTPGPHRLRVTADGFDPLELEVVATEGGGVARAEPAALSPSGPSGAIRGLVRNFAGRPLRAEITVEPGGHRITTDEDGFFELAVPPGRYRVDVAAEGHTPQHRTVRVSENGVTILNADLRRRR